MPNKPESLKYTVTKTIIRELSIEVRAQSPVEAIDLAKNREEFWWGDISKTVEYEIQKFPINRASSRTE